MCIAVKRWRSEQGDTDGVDMRRHLANQVRLIVSTATDGHSACIGAARTLLAELQSLQAGTPAAAEECATAAYYASSAVLNYADDRSERRAVNIGIDIADWARALDISAQLRRYLEYNAANGRSTRHRLLHDTTTQESRRTARMYDRDQLRQTRLLFAGVGYDRAIDGALRGTALCNLANILDDSGRWVEAYQTYRDALQADPTNGNASGNAAELLRRRIAAGRGALGHYAIVHDELADHAVEHRDRTVELAGEAVAQRWDAAPRFGGDGHREHVGDSRDEYQQWIGAHRFALATSIEGLGSDGPQWDSAGIDSLRTDGVDMPPIFTSVNVLKAEYLVARRLAFVGEQKLVATPVGQAADDPGIYVDTLDLSVYGEASSSLVLAQRATLDLLDKVAVAVNEHFAMGDEPGKITFRSFWAKGNPPTLRTALPVPEESWTPTALALAELAHDASEDGMYAAAQALRNAGTHRLVNLSWDKPDHEATDTHVPVEASELIDASHVSLGVARAAFLYLLDLIADGEGDGPEDGYLPMPVFTQQ